MSQTALYSIDWQVSGKIAIMPLVLKWILNLKYKEHLTAPYVELPINNYQNAQKFSF